MYQELFKIDCSHPNLLFGLSTLLSSSSLRFFIFTIVEIIYFNYHQISHLSGSIFLSLQVETSPSSSTLLFWLREKCETYHRGNTDRLAGVDAESFDNEITLELTGCVSVPYGTWNAGIVYISNVVADSEENLMKIKLVNGEKVYGVTWRWQIWVFPFQWNVSRIR